MQTLQPQGQKREAKEDKPVKKSEKVNGKSHS